MRFRKDIIHLPADFPFDLFVASGTPDAEPVLHFHDCLEINYILEGGGFNFIESKRYELVPGDFYIINNLEHHMASTDGSLKMLVIIFDPIFIWMHNPFDYEYLKPFFDRNIKFSNRISKDNKVTEELAAGLGTIEQEWRARQEGYRLVIKSVLMKLLAVLYRNCTLNDEIGSDRRQFQKSYDRIRGVIEHINRNLDKKLELEELARIAFMNRTYFSSYFKKVMKISMSDYIEALRVNKAMHLLKVTNSSITEIGLACGYNDISHFNRVFRRLNSISPNEYRHGKPEAAENANR